MDRKLEQRFLNRILEYKNRFANEAIVNPKDKTEFGFGEICGTQRGLILAEQLFLNVIGEDDDGTQS